MVELHGWVTIQESCRIDDEEESIEQIVRKLKEQISGMSGGCGDILDIRYCNGEPFLTITMFKNRINSDVEEVFEFLEYVCKTAPGSYGMIYMYDDESVKMPDEFQVFAIRKGKIYPERDRYLSPVRNRIYEE